MFIYLEVLPFKSPSVVKLTTKNSDGVGIKKMEKTIISKCYPSGNHYEIKTTLLNKKERIKNSFVFELYKNGKFVGIVCLSDIFCLAEKKISMVV